MSEPLTIKNEDNKPKFILRCCRAKLYKNEKCICMGKGLIKNIRKWIDSFKQNKNTGVFEEISVGIEILLRSNLDICNNLPYEYNNIKSSPHINGIVGLINLSQSDNIGGTGDIGIVYNDRDIQFFSITQWYGNTGKCICNPSATKWYGLSNTEKIKEKNSEAYNLAIKFRQDKYSENPSKKWKRTPNCPGTKMFCEYLAKEASDSWNMLYKEQKIKNMYRFLDIDNKKLKPQSNGIIYWNKKNNRIECIYKWELKINVEDYLETYSDGIYIYHGTHNNVILKTQAKYNNGIIEGMSSKIDPKNWIIKKSSSYLSSWDTVAPDLNKIFKLKPITLDK